ncbi:sugar phosphate isomerase/epimerase [Paenibacillus sp. N4]|nr:sugar phosphate isomerase/epimerase [Paenibacillus vietnamensis]
MSWWGMNGLKHLQGGEDTTEARFRMIAENGFDGINAFIPASEEAGLWKELLQHYGLSFSVNAYPSSIEDMAGFLEKAQMFGGIDYINAQVMQPFMVGDGAIRLLEGIGRLSEAAGIPVFVETHRGTITQDLIRSAEYVRALPDLKLTIDYSHYVVAGELHTVSEQAESWLQKLLPNAHSIHTRVSNGEQVQIDIGESGEHPMVPHFARWWEGAMRHCRSRASDAAFPVVIELGPPSYAITTDEAGKRSNEISDRWAQSLYLQKLVRELWEKAGQ